jgi:hypothetical protein
MAVKQQLDIPAVPNLGTSGVAYSQEVQNQNNGSLRTFFIKLANALQALTSSGGGKYINNPFGAFQSLVDQSIASANTAYAMTLDTTDYTNGVYLSNSSRMNVRNAGIYNLQWSGQFENTDSVAHDAYVWLRKNGTNVVASTGLVAVPSKHGSVDGHTIVGWNFFIELAANDYIELYWSADSTLISLQFYAAGSSPTKPSTASLIATMQYVAPNAMDNVYISSQTNGSAVITHFANSTASKTYKYIVVG